MFESQLFCSPLFLSLKIATCSTMVNAVLGTGIAFLLVHLNPKFCRILNAILTLPLVLPPTVVGYYLLMLFGKQGFLGKVLSDFGIHLVFTWQGAVIAATIVSFPLILRSAKASFENLDRRIQDAARVLGATEIEIFFRITLPLASRGIVAGILLAFSRALGEFGATIMIAGNLPGYTQTLSGSIYESICTGNTSDVFYSVIIISIACIAILLFSESIIFTQKKFPKR